MNKIKERPVILSADEVRGVLADKKNQIRRRNKLIPSWDHYGTDIMDWGLSEVYKTRDRIGLHSKNSWTVAIQSAVDDASAILINCPFGAEGDLLWVREHHARTELHSRLVRPHYFADGELSMDKRHDAGLLKRYSPVAMPRWASRLKLRVTKVDIVRVDRGVWDWVVDFEVVESGQ